MQDAWGEHMQSRYRRLLLGQIVLLSALAGVSGHALAVTISEFQIPSANSYPMGITAGPDGALWFAENGCGFGGCSKIGRITTDGTITEFAAFPSQTGPINITPGPDGALWFTDFYNNIGRITTTGAITEYPLPPGGANPVSMTGITTGPDGALWFVEWSTNKIGRITTAGAITEYPIPTATSEPLGITRGRTATSGSPKATSTRSERSRPPE
jgi:virginiamycin B lyase